MNKVTYPQPDTWASLQRRPVQPAEDLTRLAREVFEAIAQNGDEALMHYISTFERSTAGTLRVAADTIEKQSQTIPQALKEAIALATGNIKRFHEAQREDTRLIETTEGVTCWRESRPIERVGIYIPGGTAPLFSTVLMLGIPAQLAGCKNVVLCTPPDGSGNIHPAILYAARLAGISRIFAVGGIQAISAMAIGTETIPKVDKIFGPGNQYVTAAKTYAQSIGVAIDMPAGPSELLVIADATATPAFVAADLLSQAEHGTDSQVILLSDNEATIDETLAALREQLAALPRKEIAAAGLKNSLAILLPTIKECLQFSNGYAPEHLILAMDAAAAYTAEVTNAGSVFIGHYSCESAGDYASGTNHTLPTNGHARAYSGVSLDSFLKKITFQNVSREGLMHIGPAIECMAEAEGLQAHKAAVTIRRNQSATNNNQPS